MPVAAFRRAEIVFGDGRAYPYSRIALSYAFFSNIGCGMRSVVN
jgi:hypothetical protein